MTDVIYTGVLQEVYTVLGDQDLYLIDVIPCDRHICCIFTLVFVSICSTAITSPSIFCSLPITCSSTLDFFTGPCLQLFCISYMRLYKSLQRAAPCTATVSFNNIPTSYSLKTRPSLTCSWEWGGN